VVVIAADAGVQDVDDARRDEQERAQRSDQMRKDRAAVCLRSTSYNLLTYLLLIISAK